MARMPEPQPKSITVLSSSAQAVSHCKHNDVVGCVPVPNAKPGSSLIFTANGSGYVTQLGHTHKRSPDWIGFRFRIHIFCQSRSCICRLPSCTGAAKAFSIGFCKDCNSTSSKNSAVSVISCQSGIVSTSSTNIGLSLASTMLIDTAPSSSSRISVARYWYRSSRKLISNTKK